MRKGNKIINDFLADIRVVTDQLATIGSPIADNEMVQQILDTFGPDYHVFHTSLCVMPMLPTFEDLRAEPIQYDVDLAQTTQQEDEHLVMMARIPSRPQSMGPRANAAPAGRGLLLIPAQTPRATKITIYSCAKNVCILKPTVDSTCRIGIKQEADQITRQGSRWVKDTNHHRDRDIFFLMRFKISTI